VAAAVAAGIATAAIEAGKFVHELPPDVRAGENLDRCRVQFKLFESLRRQEPAMRQLVAAG